MIPQNSYRTIDEYNKGKLLPIKGGDKLAKLKGHLLLYPLHFCDEETNFSSTGLSKEMFVPAIVFT
jgi:hypothetical protein